MKTIPDWGVSPTQLASPDIDNAELAARLSLNRFRRSGRVVYMDNCESLAGWKTGGSFGWAVAVDSTYAYEGTGSIKLTPGTAPPATYEAHISKTIPALGLLTNINTKLGIDFYFSAEYFSGGVADLELSCLFDPVEAFQASDNRLRFNFGGGGATNPGGIDYYEGAAWHSIPFPVQSLYGTFKYSTSRYGPYMLPYTNPSLSTWHNIKAILGFGKYYDIYFDGVKIPFNRSISLIPTPGYSINQIGFLYRDVSTTHFWVDNIVITIDEA